MIKQFTVEVMIPATEKNIAQVEKDRVDMAAQLVEFKADVKDTKIIE